MDILSDEMALGFKASAGGWSTSVVPLSGGREHRNQNWAFPRRHYEFAYEVRTPEQWKPIQAFMDEQKGMLNAWLLKDWSNYQLVNHPILVAAGAETTAQIRQRLGVNGQFVRPVHHIKSGTLVVRKNGTPLTLTTQYTVNSTGLITFVSALAENDVIAVDCEFYVKVRFEQDSFMISVDGAEARFARIPTISAVEVLD